MERATTDYSCPSAQPDMQEARVFGIVGGSVEQPRVSYLAKGVEVPPDVQQAIGDVNPTRVFRYAAKCENAKCGQFASGSCRLGADVLRMLAPVSDELPACTIRGTCRWFAENGRDVCFRCARIVTTVFDDDSTLSPLTEARLQGNSVVA